MPYIKAEYIWLDGYAPTAGLRSKTKILDHEVNSLSDIPQWGFDGSSTRQADGASTPIATILEKVTQFLK